MEAVLTISCLLNSITVVPELNQELHVWIERQPLMARLDELDAMLGDIFMNLDSSSLEKPDISKVQMTIRWANTLQRVLHFNYVHIRHLMMQSPMLGFLFLPFITYNHCSSFQLCPHCSSDDAEPYVGFSLFSCEKQLYKRLCPSVRGSVRLSVGPSVTHFGIQAKK